MHGAVFILFILIHGLWLIIFIGLPMFIVVHSRILGAYMGE